MGRLHHGIRTFCILGAFVFTFLGVHDLFLASDLVFDRFMSAGILFAMLLWYRTLHQTVLTLIPALVAVTLHALKLYGNVYAGIPFDMIMHFAAGFAIALVLFSYLRSCEGIGCLNPWKLAFLAVFATAGLGTLMEMIEYFGYTHLAPGEGILHFGVGDEGEWNDAIWDMICNLLGAITAASLGMFACRKRVPFGLLRHFIRRYKRRQKNCA